MKGIMMAPSVLPYRRVNGYGTPDRINLAGIYPGASCLGPGRRCIIWVQGCLQRCKGCIAPSMQPLTGRQWVTVPALVGYIKRIDGIEGVTVVGGEPFLQPAALARGFELLGSHLDLGKIVYTGYLLEDLQLSADPDVLRLIEQTDLLVDGPYMEEQDFSQKWRGSANQRFHFLTERYQEWAWVEERRERDVDLILDVQGNYLALGIPPKGFFDLLF